MNHYYSPADDYGKRYGYNRHRCCYNCVYMVRRRNGKIYDTICQNGDSDAYGCEVMNDEHCECFEEKT